MDNSLPQNNPLLLSISSYILDIENPTNNQSKATSFHEVTVTIRHPKVVQKSYKNEKRFFCPSPSIRIGGKGWGSIQSIYTSATQSPANGNRVSNSAKSFPQCLALVDLWPDHGNSTPLKKQYASFRYLYFSDKDKRKIFQLETEIFLSPTIALGTFLSNQIRVISKPSKKKQSLSKDRPSIPNTLSHLQDSETSQLPNATPATSSGQDTMPLHLELKLKNPASIFSGSNIAIFNRGRSQAVATRYLSTNQDGSYEGTSMFWEVFTIDLVDDDIPDDATEYKCRDGIVTYGCHTRLSSENGVILPTLKIERVEKQKLMCHSQKEPLGQLQKVAFKVVATGEYLAFSENQVVQISISEQENNSQSIVPDYAMWTVVSVDQVQYKFHSSLSTMSSSSCVIGPCPTISKVGDTFFQGKYLLLELFGSFFTPNLIVFFSSVPTLTFYRTSELMFCLVPYYKHFFRSKDSTLILDIPLYLWKKDGVLYQTDKKFIYKLYEHANIEQHSTNALHCFDVFREIEPALIPVIGTKNVSSSNTGAPKSQVGTMTDDIFNGPVASKFGTNFTGIEPITSQSINVANFGAESMRAENLVNVFLDSVPINSTQIGTVANNSESFSNDEPIDIDTFLASIGAPPNYFVEMQSEIGTMPPQIGTMPSQIGTMPPQIGTMPSQIGTMPPQIGTMPSQIGTMPPQIGTMPYQIGTMPFQYGTISYHDETMPYCDAMLSEIGTMPSHIEPTRSGVGNIPSLFAPKTMLPQIGTISTETGTMLPHTLQTQKPHEYFSKFSPLHFDNKACEKEMAFSSIKLATHDNVSRNMQFDLKMPLTPDQIGTMSSQIGTMSPKLEPSPRKRKNTTALSSKNKQRKTRKPNIHKLPTSTTHSE